MSTPIIEIEIPLPPKELSPNAYVHWRAKSKAKKEYRRSVLYFAVAAMGQKTLNLKECRIQAKWVFTKNARRDRDNLLASLKTAFDALTLAKVLTDDYGVEHMNPEIKIDPNRLRGHVTLCIYPPLTRNESNDSDSAHGMDADRPTAPSAAGHDCIGGGDIPANHGDGRQEACGNAGVLPHAGQAPRNLDRKAGVLHPGGSAGVHPARSQGSGRWLGLSESDSLALLHEAVNATGLEWTSIERIRNGCRREEDVRNRGVLAIYLSEEKGLDWKSVSRVIVGTSTKHSTFLLAARRVRQSMGR